MSNETNPVRNSRADRTWLWALVSFSALALCSLAVLLAALTGGNLDEFRPGPSWTPGAPAAQVSPASQPGDLSLGSGVPVAVVYDGGVNLRRTPGYQNKPAGDSLKTIASGAQGVVVTGPEDVDGLRWWKVRFGGDEGWMAERSSQGRLLLARQ